MSQMYNEVENMMKIVAVEIAFNVLNLLLIIFSTWQMRQSLQPVSASGPSNAPASGPLNSPASGPSNAPATGPAPPPISTVTVVVLVIEMLFEAVQVACSALTLQSIVGAMKPVNELFSSLVGKYSENAELCVLPCCGSSSGSQIVC